MTLQALGYVAQLLGSYGKAAREENRAAGKPIVIHVTDDGGMVDLDDERVESLRLVFRKKYQTYSGDTADRASVLAAHVLMSQSVRPLDGMQEASLKALRRISGEGSVVDREGFGDVGETLLLTMRSAGKGAGLTASEFAFAPRWRAECDAGKDNK